jgi:hypothetical protein
MTPILPQAEELLSILKQLMPTMYQKETLESILALLLQGQGHSLPHHCLTKSEFEFIAVKILHLHHN